MFTDRAGYELPVTVSPARCDVAGKDRREIDCRSTGFPPKKISGTLTENVHDILKGLRKLRISKNIRFGFSAGMQDGRMITATEIMADLLQTQGG